MTIFIDGFSRKEVAELVSELEGLADIPDCRIVRIVGRHTDGTLASDDIRIEIAGIRRGIFFPFSNYQENIEWAVNGVRATTQTIHPRS